MIFSIGKSIVVLTDQLSILKYQQDEDSHIWPGCEVGKPFDIKIPKKYYNEKQALNKAKVWIYELILDSRLKKTYQNN